MMRLGDRKSRWHIGHVHYGVLLLGHLAWVNFTYQDGIVGWEQWVVATETGYATYSPGVATEADRRGFYVVVFAGLLFFVTQVMLLCFCRLRVVLLSLPVAVIANCLLMLVLEGAGNILAWSIPATADWFNQPRSYNLPWSVGFYGGLIVLAMPGLLVIWGYVIYRLLRFRKAKP